MDDMNRRRKILLIDEEDVLGVLTRGITMRDNQTVLLRRYKGVPDGVIVKGVQYEFPTLSFAFCLQHESFDPVPVGTMLPYFTAGTEEVVVKRIR